MVVRILVGVPAEVSVGLGLGLGREGVGTSKFGNSLRLGLMGICPLAWGFSLYVCCRGSRVGEDEGWARETGVPRVLDFERGLHDREGRRLHGGQGLRS